MRKDLNKERKISCLVIMLEGIISLFKVSDNITNWKQQLYHSCCGENFLNDNPLVSLFTFWADCKGSISGKFISMNIMLLIIAHMVVDWLPSSSFLVRWIQTRHLLSLGCLFRSCSQIRMDLVGLARSKIYRSSWLYGETFPWKIIRWSCHRIHSRGFRSRYICFDSKSFWGEVLCIDK